MNQTKQDILQAALNLFSQKGFTAVSIRHICAEVQIKESSIYYHFKNKEAILDEILLEFQSRSESLIARMTAAFPSLTAGKPSQDLFNHIMEAYVDHYLADPFCNKVIRLLSIDQLHNEKVQQLYTYWLFDKPLEIQRFVCTVFQQAGAVPITDSDLAAEQFYAPVFFCLSRYLLTGELTEERILQFKSALTRHMKEFLS